MVKKTIIIPIAIPVPYPGNRWAYFNKFLTVEMIGLTTLFWAIIAGGWMICVACGGPCVSEWEPCFHLPATTGLCSFDGLG